MKKILKIVDFILDIIGYICAFIVFLMLLNVFYDVISRYFFRYSSIAMQEMEWHLFSLSFIIGMSYALKSNSHVRVDIFYDKMKPKNKAIINIFGSLFFILPFSLVLICGGYDFFSESLEINEISGDPGGLPYRWLIKSSILVSFVLLLLSTFSFIMHNIYILKGDSEANK